MGHGRFLLSQWRGVKSRQLVTGQGHVEVDTRFEIRFGSFSKTLHPYRGYQGSKAQSTDSDTEAPEATGFTATMHLNPAKNGVELRFFGNPPAEVLESARAAGFRQNRWKTFWYAKQDANTLAFAREISGEQQKQGQKPSEVPEEPIKTVEKEQPAAEVTPIPIGNISNMEQIGLFAA